MRENLYKTTGEFIPDNLIADNKIPITTKGISVAAGQGLLKRGTLLGVSDSGKYKVTGTKEMSGEGESAVESTVGCDCILTDDVDAADMDVVASAYVTGTFNRNALSLAEGTEIENYETELRRLGIFLRSVQKY